LLGFLRRDGMASKVAAVWHHPNQKALPAAAPEPCT
jgi:hypothetical protein